MAAKGYSASKWAYALRSGVHRARKQARRMPFAQLYRHDAVCLPDEMLIHHAISGPVGRGIGDEASDEGFRGGQ